MRALIFQRLRARLWAGGFGATLVRGGLGSSIVQGVNLTARVLTAVVLARVLGAEGFGIYALAMAIVRVVQIPAQSGLSNVGLRFTAAYAADTRWAAMRGLWRRLTQWALAYGAIAIVGVLALALALGYRGATDELAATLAGAAPLVIFSSLLILYGALMRGLHHTVHGQMPEYVIRPASFLIFVGFAAWLLKPGQIGPEQVILLQLLAAAFALGLGAYWLRSVRPIETLTAATHYESSQWLKTTLPLTVTGGMMILNNEVDILMLGMLAEPRDVGIYRVATQGANMVVFFLTAINLVIAPQISKLYAQGEHGALQKMLTWSTRIIFFGALCIASVFWLAGRQILGWVFGPEFVAGYAALAILCIGQLVNAGCGPVGTILNMTGFERDTALGAGVAAVLNIALNAALIPHYGMQGAATATTISMLVWNAILVYLVYRRTGLVSSMWGQPKKQEENEKA